MSRGIGLQYVAPGLTLSSDRLVTSNDSSTPLCNMGTLVVLEDGRTYKYGRFVAATAIGQLLEIADHVTITNATSAASDNTITKTGAFTASYYNDPKDEYYVGLNSGTGFGQVRRVISNTADVLTLDANWTTAIDTTTDGVVFGTGLWELAEGAGHRVAGVAISAQSAGYYGWIQTKGFCPLIRVAGGTDPLARGEGIVSSAAAGVGKGLTTAGTTADEADKVFAEALYAYAGADAAGIGVAGFLHCSL